MANNFLPFCPTDTGTNLLTQGDYAVATDRTVGNQSGVASAKLVNKAIRQATFIASQFAQFIANVKGVDVLDDGVAANLLAQITASFLPAAPVITYLTSGSGTFNRAYLFTITSGNATTGATYTNNGVTYTVVSTVASATRVVMRGSNIPAVAGTLTKTGGTGDSTLTFQAYTIPLYTKLILVGPGGGSGGSGTSQSGGVGGDGQSASTFGTVTCNPGQGGPQDGTYAVGGTATGGDRNIQGGNGGGRATVESPGSAGGSNPLGGAGSTGETNGGAAQSARANTGAGGGAPGASTTIVSGGSGAAGGYSEKTFANPAVTYSYVIGAAGLAGTAGSGGLVGAPGADGSAYIEEHFQ